MYDTLGELRGNMGGFLAHLRSLTTTATHELQQKHYTEKVSRLSKQWYGKRTCGYFGSAKPLQRSYWGKE